MPGSDEVIELQRAFKALSVNCNVAANSRLIDTDFARETAVRTRNMIVREFQVSLMGQANLSSDLVLRLLA